MFLIRLALATGRGRGDLGQRAWIGEGLRFARPSRCRGAVRFSQKRKPRPRVGDSAIHGYVNALKAQRKRKIEESLATGEAWENTNAVFTKITGVFVNHTAVYHAMEKVVKQRVSPGSRPMV